MDAWIFERFPVLPLVRMLAVATAFPMISGPGASRNIRVTVALVFGLAVTPVPAPPSTTLTPEATLAALPFEILIGFTIGYSFALLFQVLAIAGDFLGQEMGLNTASQIDPISGRSVPLLAQLFETVGLVLFVEFGGFALLLRTVKDSLVTLPPGALIQPLLVSGQLTELTVSSIRAGIAIALPAGMLLLVLTIFTTITARVLPRLHIFDFAYALRMIGAILLVALLLPRLVPHMLSFTTLMHERLLETLVAR